MADESKKKLTAETKTPPRPDKPEVVDTPQRPAAPDAPAADPRLVAQLAAEDPTSAAPVVGEVEVPKEKKATLGDRMDRIEAAFTAALGRPLHEFDSAEVKRAREQVALDAALKAQEIIDAAVREVVKPLTQSERLDRIEAIVNSSLNVPLG